MNVIGVLLEILVILERARVECAREQVDVLLAMARQLWARTWDTHARVRRLEGKG